VLDAGDINPQRLLFLRRRLRVVETQSLDEAAVATVTLVGHDDVEERALLGATA
jgi:hypothetical protein